LNTVCDNHYTYCVETNWYGSCLRYEEGCSDYKCPRYRRECSVVIKNLDDTSGTWTVSGYSSDKYNKDFIKSIDVYVTPYQKAYAWWSFNYDSGDSVSCDYVVDAPKKSVCNDEVFYQKVQKLRGVIKSCSLWDKLNGKCKEVKLE
jgi:hypothetical protein